MRSYNKVFIDKQKLEEMLKLRQLGYSTLFLGERYNVDHSSIVYHCLKNKVIIDKNLKERRKIEFKGEKKKSLNYIDLFLIEEQKKQKRMQNCNHKKWFKKCSCCGKIIESERGCISREINI